MLHQAKTILRETFGYDRFRPMQQEVIRQALNKRDSLVIMPTGGGKSLCYQLPALIFDGLTVVISPLISLMKDQVEQLEALGVPAVCLNSSLEPEVYRSNLSMLKDGKVKLLYVAPETLLMPKIRNLLARLQLDCMTIDEAHCISEWGHDFRPEYRQLSELRKDYPEAVCLALTATATTRVRNDIMQTLEMEESELFTASFDRKNLNLAIVDKSKPLEQLLDFLHTRGDQSGIIYCFSRRQVDELTEDLRVEGYSVRGYHAGLREQERTDHQNAFIRDDVSIIVATVAFGMGINKPDVRYVVHFDMPRNIESYYQQIGRAGRDGLPSDCLLLYSYADTRKIRYFINQKEGREKQVASEQLERLVDFLETGDCRRKPLMAYFGEAYAEENCGMCDNCLQPAKPEEDLTVAAQKFLSCVARTNEVYGAYHIADILRGSKARRILENGHDKLSTHGIGREWSKARWVQLSRLLIRKEYLRKDPEYGSLSLGTAACSLLEGSEKVKGVLDRTRTPASGKSASQTKKEMKQEHDPSLFEKLRQKRKSLADEQGVPPYVIFPDTTLMEMACYFPQKPESLLRIYGIGEVKKRKYGPVFLSLISEYCRDRRIDEREKR